jgi:hypothetical protein
MSSHCRPSVRPLLSQAEAELGCVAVSFNAALPALPAVDFGAFSLDEGENSCSRDNMASDEIQQSLADATVL